MTLTEAREHVGAWAIYTPGHGAREVGKIVSVGGDFVFVRYTGDVHSKATRPADLALSTGSDR